MIHDLFISSNERIIVKELTEKYDSTINTLFDRTKYKGGYSYKVHLTYIRNPSAFGFN